MDCAYLLSYCCFGTIHCAFHKREPLQIGFLLEARTACGGLVLADDKERVMTFSDLEEEVCNITIRKREESDSGIVLRLWSELSAAVISKHRCSKNVLLGTAISDVQLRWWRSCTVNLNSLAFLEISLQHTRAVAQSREAKGPYLIEAAATHEEFRAKNEIRIAFVKGNTLLATRMAIAYSTTIDKCGGEITAREGYISIPEIQGDFDCIWTLRENPGNGVRASVT
ncbi:hypothetical protein COOONC_03213 [Cooperia oncophora]